MTPHPVAVTPFDSLEDILFLFSHHKFTWLPVIQNDKLKGIILQSDVLKALFTESQVTNSGNGTPVEGKSEQTQVPTSSENTQRLPQEPAKESRSPSADTPT
jgi:Mg/Co/Ni transporter MgtE